MAKKTTLRLLICALTLCLALPAAAMVVAGPTTSVLEPAPTQAPADTPLVAKRRGKRKKKRTKKRRSRRAKHKPAQAPTPQIDASTDNQPIVTTRRGPARVDFDDRLVQGQTNKTGTIYIFERKTTEMETMVQRRRSFRREITDSIL